MFKNKILIIKAEGFSEQWGIIIFDMKLLWRNGMVKHFLLAQSK